MKKIKDEVNVNQDGKKVVVTRTIQEEYEVEELKKLVNNMEENLKKLEKQIEVLQKQRDDLKQNLEFWKSKI